MSNATPRLFRAPHAATNSHRWRAQRRVPLAACALSVVLLTSLCSCQAPIVNRLTNRPVATEQPSVATPHPARNVPAENMAANMGPWSQASPPAGRPGTTAAERLAHLTRSRLRRDYQLAPSVRSYCDPHTGDTGVSCAHCGPSTPACWDEDPLRPRDEYLCDGGDRFPPVAPHATGSEQGLDLEDTVAQYRTASGDLETTPSTRACVYAPRFAAVRRVTGLTENEAHTLLNETEEQLALTNQQLNLPAGAVAQPLASVRGVRNLMPQGLQDGQPGRTVDDVDQAIVVHNKLLPFENLQIIRTGTYDAHDKPILAQGILAAQVWSEIAAVQVTVNDQQADLIRRAALPQETYEYTVDGEPCLRVVKIASAADAQPGDSVHFTIRFDNTGSETLTEVVLTDNLTTRLAYVENSQECTLDAQFDARENEGQSSLLTWKLNAPLPPGKGGIIRFECRVR